MASTTVPAFAEQFALESTGELIELSETNQTVIRRERLKLDQAFFSSLSEAVTHQKKDVRLLERVETGTLTLPLRVFQDVVQARIRGWDPLDSGYALYGELVEQPFSTFTLLVRNGLIRGKIRSPQGTFIFRSLEPGLHVVEEVDLSLLPPGAEPRHSASELEQELFSGEPESSEDRELYRKPTILQEPSSSWLEPVRDQSNSTSDKLAPTDSDSQVLPIKDERVYLPDLEHEFRTEHRSSQPRLDTKSTSAPSIKQSTSGESLNVLFLFSSDILRRHDTPQIVLAIEEAFLELNVAFRAGGLTVQATLSGIYRVDWDSEGQLVASILDKLQSQDDGVMDDVHLLRDQTKSDLVHLIVIGNEHDQYCGIANLPKYHNSWQAFGITKYDCLSNATVAHELGHNLGINHDRYTVNDFTMTKHPFDYGYVNQRQFVQGASVASRWRTIMAYAEQCNNHGWYCPLVLRFSNPEQRWLGDPLGISGETETQSLHGPSNAIRTIKANFIRVARYRGLRSDSRPNLTAQLEQSERTSRVRLIGSLQMSRANLRSLLPTNTGQN